MPLKQGKRFLKIFKNAITFSALGAYKYVVNK